MISKEGGNQLHGQVFSTGATGGMQSDNVTPDLVARGVKLDRNGRPAANRIDSIYDANLSLGGPIRRDRVWFFGSFRRWGANRLVANTLNPDGTQALDDNRLTDVLGRATLQLSPRNKLTASWDEGFKFRGHRRSNFNAQFFGPEATFRQTTDQNYISQMKWTSPVTNTLLLEAGISLLKVAYFLDYQPGTEGSLARFDFTNSILSNAAAYGYSSDALIRAYAASLSYVTGQHNIKVGMQLREGPYHDTYRKNGDILLRFNGNRADSVDEFNTPVDEREQLDADLGAYIQDSWTLRRLTVNAGARFEHLAYSIPVESAPAGTYVPARHFDARSVVDWNNAVPRLGLVYDLLGDGRTALRLSASKYMQNEGVSIAQKVNPMFLDSDRHRWNDANGDGVPQPNEIDRRGTGFAGSVNTRIDPGIRRPYNWEYAASVQHELMPRLSVMAGYFGRRLLDLYGSINVLVPRSAYLPVPITNPLTGAPLVVYNQDPSTKGLNNLFLTNQAILDTHYDGFEVQVNKRFDNAAVLFGGYTYGRNRGRTTSGGNNPNDDVNAVGAVGFDSTNQTNIAGSYPLRYGMQLSGSLRVATGQPLNRSLTLTTALVPGLTQVNQAVLLLPRGTHRLPQTRLLDLRFSKSFTVRLGRLEAVADLFNVLNANATTGEVEAVGPSLGRPSAILDGRLLRLGVQWRF